mgnify:CR=1 FL=1|jgi:hypothetical protein
MNKIINRYKIYIRKKLDERNQISKINSIIVENSTYLNNIYNEDFGCSDLPIYIPDLLLRYYSDANKNRILLSGITMYSCIGILGGLVWKNWKYPVIRYIVGGILGFALTCPCPIDNYWNKNITCRNHTVGYRRSIYIKYIFDFFRTNGEIYTSKLYGINNDNHKRNKLREIYEFIKYKILGFDIVSDKNPYVIYEGKFKKLRYHGDGKLYYPNGQLFIEGDFYDGLPIWSKKIYSDNGKLLFENKNMNIEHLQLIHKYTLQRLETVRRNTN